MVRRFRQRASGVFGAIAASAAVALAACGVLPAVAAGVLLGVVGAALGVTIARRRRRRRRDSWEVFEQAFWSYVAGPPRSDRRSPRTR